MATADHRLEVVGETVTTSDHLVEIVVRDKDDRAFEHEGPLETLALSVFHLRLGQPRQDAGVGRVARDLEKVQGRVVEEDGVSVVEHDHGARFLVFPQGLVETGRPDETLDDRILDVAGSLEVREDLVDAIGLAETRRTRDDDGAVLAGRRRIRHGIHDVEPVGELRLDFFVGLDREGRRRSRDARDVREPVTSVTDLIFRDEHEIRAGKPTLRRECQEVLVGHDGIGAKLEASSLKEPVIDDVFARHS